MALRAGYYGVKRFLRDKLETIAKTYDETIKGLFLRSEQTVLGAKNWFDIKKGSDTINGVTYTVNADKSITVNGTASANSLFIANDNVSLIAGKAYKITKGINDQYPQINLNATNNGVFVKNLAALTTQNEVEFIPDFNGYNRVECIIYVPNGISVSNKTVSLMIRLASDPDPTYASYAMTNKELTDSVAELTTSAADQKTAINAIITAATGAADFAAFKTAMGAITPVTRSLSLTKEDITEEVKEAEPEKTVTKKRTTKKTEEV